MNENGSQTLMEKVKVLVHKISGKKLIVWSIAGAVAAVGIAGVVYHIRTEDKGEMPKSQIFNVSGNGVTNEYVTASGTTSLGYTMDEFEPDYIDTELYIEEVYLSSGDEVTAGVPVFKVAEESITEAREELEDKKEETSLAYRAGLISYEQSKINAKYTYDAAVLEGKQAEDVYNSAVKDAEEKLQMAKDNVTEAEEQIEEYTNANAGYYDKYNIEEYKERYDKNNIYYNTFLEEYGFSESDLSESGQGSQSSKMDSQQDDAEEEAAKEETAEDGAKQEGVTKEETTQEGAAEEETTQEETTQEGAAEEETTKEETTQEGETKEGASEETTTEEETTQEETTGDLIQEGSEESMGISSVSELDSWESDSRSLSEDPLLLSLFADWNTTLSRLTTSASLGDGISLISVTFDRNNEDYARKLQTIQQMKKNLEDSQSAYDKAWNEYELATEQAATQLKKLNAKIESLRADLTEAETTYQLEILEAETNYKKSLARTELAQSDYDTTMQKASDELETLEDEKTEAEENLAEFESLLGDGYFYTQNAGTVMMVDTRSDSNLQGGSMVVAYRNAEDISVTVSVSQEDINKLEVGDSAQVIIEEYGTFEGKITYLNPVSNSDSRTNITYEVIVDLNGDRISNLTENLTAMVIFQTGDSSQ